ncbi:hypothetical protein ACPXAO_23670, partial [Salmonella enterica]|uniref:hypothetical protein n=1 Tax=Salmonella enterica TaxID=28901 RepID=UPI003CF3C6B8
MPAVEGRSRQVWLCCSVWRVPHKIRAIGQNCVFKATSGLRGARYPGTVSASRRLGDDRRAKRIGNRPD